MGLSKKFLEELEKSEKLIDNVAVISPYSNETSKETKKKRQNSVSTRSSESSVDFFEELDRLIAEKEEEDIAPLPFTDRDLLDETSKGLREAWKAKAEEEEKKEKESKGLDFFDSGAFRNGYNAGDVTKTILGTVGDVGLNLVEGVVGTVEGIVDLGAYGVAGVADVFGADKWADNLKKTTSKSQTDFLFGGASDYLDKYSVLGRTSESIVQGIGQVGGLIATGGLGKTAKAATAITTGVMGASGMGSGMSEAYQGGATDGEAVAYGAISGTADALTEMIFGGLGKSINAVGFSKGLSSADDMLAKTLSNKISSKLAKNLVQFGVKASGEGLEEVLAGIAQAAGKKATYMSEEDFWGILQDENLLEQFIVGAMASGVTQSGGLVKAIKTGTDFITGYTDNEQSVIDKEVEKRIAEQEKDGKKLSNSEKKKITEAVKEDLDKGYISIDTIEEVLGGDSYKSYKETVESEDALRKELEDVQKEHDEINGLTIGERTGTQDDRLKELKSKLEELKPKVNALESSTVKNELKSKLSAEVQKLLATERNGEGAKLLESYREVGRRREKFTADVSKYKGIAAESIQSIIDKGQMQNTNRAHEVVDFAVNLASKRGKKVTTTTTAEIIEKAEKKHGWDYVVENFLKVDENGKPILAKGKSAQEYKYELKTKPNAEIDGDTIALNVNSPNITQGVIGHEIGHTFEGTKYYNRIAQLLNSYDKSIKGKAAYDAQKQAIGKRYANVKGANAQYELNADLLGEYIFSDENFVKHLTQDRNVFQRVYDQIKYMVKYATAGSQQQKDLIRIQQTFEKAWREAEKTSNKSKNAYSLVEVEAVEPTSGKWHRSHTTEEVKAQFPDLWDVTAEDSDVRNPTQIQGTVKSYRKIYDFLASEGFDGKILDASSGLGYGTQAGIEEYGFEVDDIEPYPDKSYSPKYTDYSTLDNTYDAIISNAVLNVLPQDQRDALVVKMGEMLNDGGRIFVNVRGSDVKNASSKVAIDESQMEYYIAQSGSYQKGFTKAELVAYLEDTLGDGFTVTPSNMFGVVSAVVTKNGEAKYSLYEFEDGQRFVGVEADQAQFDDLSIKEQTDLATKIIKERYQGKVIGLENRAFVNGKTADEYTHPAKHIDSDLYEAKMRASTELDNLMDAGFNFRKGDDGQDGHTHPDVTDGFDYFDVIFKVGNEYYQGVINIKNVSKGKLLKDITKIKNITKDVTSRYGETPSYAFLRDVSMGSVAQKEENVNSEFSLSSDSQGRELTEEQSEYFKDAKTKDENGNLLVMYHGTPNGDFTVFKDGTYFTANKEYADKYQNPGASSLNSRKVASSPKTFETYLNITKPFDIKDAEARNIYINDYIKGGNAVGINPYLSDAEYNKIDSIDWTEGEDLREFLIENGYDYDGLVLDEGAVGGYGEDVEYRGTSYVVFSPEQVKNVDNKNPTSNPDIRFSLSKAVEETNDLMAIHNLKGAELLKSLELGGLPMPSIAVIKAEANHDQYGEISLILPKEAIDPKANKDNKIYGADAWTPTYPKIEFKPNEAVEKKISDKYYELHNKYGSEDARPLYKYTYDLERVLNNYGGEAAMLEDLYNSTNLMRAYLLDTGKGKVETIQKEVRTELSDAEVEMNEFFINELGADVVDGVMARGADSPSEHRIKYWKEHGDKIKEAYSKLLSEKYGFTAEQIENVLLGMKTYDYLKFIRDAHLYRINGRVTTKTEADNEATENAIKEAAGEGYKAWVDSLFKGIEEKSGIRNNVEYFTNSGNRRKWEALHWENTLENVVRVMKQQNQTGADAIFGAHQIFATAAKNYGSIDEVKADSHRLYKMSEEEYEAIKDSYSQRMLDIANRIMDKGERNQFIALDNAMECIVDAVRKSKAKAGIYKEMKQYQQLNVTEQDVEDIVSLVTDISNMPTGYFESKPMRAVGFDEVGVFVIPNNADVKLKQELLNRGYSIAEYDPNVEGDRQKVVNSFEEYKFSLSDVGEAPRGYGSYNVYGRGTPLSDLRYEGDDIAPISTENVQETTRTPTKNVQNATQDLFPDDIAPMTEDEAAMIENEALDSLTDEDAPPAVEMPYYDETRDTATIDDKSLKGISERASEYLGLGRTERAVLEGIIQKYSQDENVTRDQLYSEIRDKFGVLEDSMPNEDVIQIKKDLRNMRIYVSDEVKADFGDSREDGYSKFLRSNFGRLRLVKDIESGVPVDSAYEELSGLYPSYFPEDIINPADQLRRISEMASAESNDVLPVELSDEEIQKVADMVYSDITGYMNDSRLEAATEASHIPLDDDLAPVPEEETALVQEKSILFEDYESKKADIQKLIDDKNGFISKRANELYWELSRLKKGVRASEELGYLLDQGYSWGELKTALVNTKLHPDSRVREDSAIESIVREALNEEYENLAYEIDEIDSEYNEKVQKLEADAKAENKVLSVREVYEQKLANHRNSLAALEAGKEKSLANFNEAIGKKLNEYNSLKNKNTKRANTLLQQMENLRLRRDNVQADYANRIAKQQARLEAFESKSYEEFEQKELAVRRRDNHKRIVDGIKARFTEQGYDLDEVFDKAKNLSTFATVDNTPQRVMEKSLGYKEGQILSDLTVDQVARNESEGIKWLNSVTNKKDGLLAQLVKKYGIKPGSKASAAAQMYAEGFFVDTNGDVIKYGDAELAKDFPNEQVRQNIIGLARDQRVRQFYDETLDKINESRVRNAYPEIQKLDNYFLHFRAMEDTFSRLGLPFNPNDIKAKDLPTDLNGVTADLKPGQPYFASARHREGIRTSHDLLGGLERYASSAKNQIYHIDDIQTLRAIRNYIADGYGQAKGLESLDSLSEEEAQEKIKQVYGSHLSTFAKFLNEEANVIAGKTALIDRGLEGIIGRRGITLIDTINKQVGANMVGFNVSSSLTNFIPVAQTFAKSNKFDFTKAFAQTASNKINSIFGRSDEFIDNNPTVLRRRGADRFYQTPYQKVGDIGYTLMGVVDDISTELIVRTKYNEYTRKGMSEQDAVNAADKWTSRLMADRSLGQMPQIYNSRMLGLFTKFQLEVRNQLDAQFYDTIQEKKVSNEDIENGLLRNAKTAAQVTSTFAQLAIAQHLYGMAFEAIAGYNPAFDIVSVLATALGFDDDEDDEDTVLDNLGQGFLELLEDLPYTSALTGGGRIPISSALPVEDVLTAISGQDANGNEISRKDAWKTVGEAAPYYFMPGGYGQLKKTIKGMEMFDEDLPIAGSYTDSGKLRYPVDDTVKNRLQAAIFGQYANENAGKYFDGGHKALDEKQIQEFIDVDIPIEDYWDYREGLYALNKKSETGTASLAEKIDYIMSLDLPIEKKNLLANNLTERKEPIDLTGYEEYGNYKDFDFAKKYPEKYAFLQDHNISVSEYEEFDEDTKEAYTWASKNPAKYKVSKAISDDLLTYRSYTDALYDIKADKDEDGKSISGSRKEKVINYINNLDADYGQKIILFKSEYPTDDTYNYEIIDYLNGRDDISYSDMVTILTELGFKVEGDNVYWD